MNDNYYYIEAYDRDSRKTVYLTSGGTALTHLRKECHFHDLESVAHLLNYVMSGKHVASHSVRHLQIWHREGDWLTSVSSW